MDPRSLREAIVGEARALGFDKVGFAPAELPAEAPRLAEWLANGRHGEMRWMERSPERRTDASMSLASTLTVVCCALNYYQGAPVEDAESVISSYARGRDYHDVLTRRLEALARFIESRAEVPTRAYVDTGPLLEKPYAVSAGLGWMGKHSNLISRDGSSWFFLGEILVPMELPFDEPKPAHCGTCERCIDACPTRAIVEPYVVDSRLCISYLTIELKGPIPRELRRLVGNRIYGCDDCQDVCPWNRFAKKSEEAAFFPTEPLRSMDLVAMMRMTHQEWLDATRGSAIRRARYRGFLRNVAVALGNGKDPGATDALAGALEHDEALVRMHAAWALGELAVAPAVKALEARLPRESDPAVVDEIEAALTAARR